MKEIFKALVPLSVLLFLFVLVSCKLGGNEISSTVANSESNPQEKVTSTADVDLVKAYENEEISDEARKIIAEINEEKRPLTYDEFVKLAGEGCTLRTKFISLKGDEITPDTALNIALSLPSDPINMSPEDRGYSVEHWLVQPNEPKPSKEMPKELKENLLTLEGLNSWYSDIEGNWVVKFDDSSVVVYNSEGKYLRGGKYPYKCLPYNIEIEGKQIVFTQISYDYSSTVQYSDGKKISYNSKGEILDE